jgi:rhodanese-related sulfurtransferase
MRSIAPAALALVLSLSGCVHARPATALQVGPQAATAKKALAPAAHQIATVEIKQTDVNGVAGLLAANPKLLFLDVRQPEEYAAGHAPGATLRPLPDLATWAAKLDKHAPVMVMCRSGHRSMQAATQLVGLGFTDVTNVQGGFLAWQAAGLPIEK